MKSKFKERCFIDEDKQTSGTMFTSIDAYEVAIIEGEEEKTATKYHADIGLVKAGHAFNNSWAFDKENKEQVLKGVNTMINMLSELKNEIIKLG